MNRDFNKGETIAYISESDEISTCLITDIEPQKFCGMNIATYTLKNIKTGEEFSTVECGRFRRFQKPTNKTL